MNGNQRIRSGRRAWATGLLACVLLALAVGSCGRQKTTKTTIATEPVARRDIVVTVEATGTVEPIDLVEVKSKASGQIENMPVEIGTTVPRGQLLVQIDTRDVKNAYDQVRAALVAAQARVQVTSAAKKRSDELFSEQVITAAEYEAAMLDDANSKSQLVKARTDLDLAQQRLEDATVRAPIAGTVLEKPVSVGQVISSATSSVSGGTTILKMADLSRIRVRALVTETDIGKVRSGQTATVVVDAHPQRNFQGEVEKIEPQAVVQQSVTMFPVLISISNEQGLLMPGMNGEVTVLIDERNDVLAVPVDALRGVREVSGVATTLGLDADSLSAQVQAQAQAMAAANRAGGDSVGGGMRVEGAAAGPGRGDGAAQTGEFRRGERNGGGSGLGRHGSRGGGAGASGDSTRRRRSGAGAGGDVAGGGGRGFGTGGGAGGGGGDGGRMGRGSRAQVVVVKTASGYVPRVVRVGISNYDYAQILQGVEEGEAVVLLGVVDLQQQRAESMQRIRQRVGTGIPGSQGGAGGGRGGAGGGGGGGGGGAGSGRRGGGS